MMKIKTVNLINVIGGKIGQGIAWGNNAAWHCSKCDQLLGGRTADPDYVVMCICGAQYEILRSPNKSGKLNLGPATGIKKI
ncbi:MAG: hypothetical protein HQM16_17700 [Deltaproteobacteria bacterium]|nr:hypothetical protein [Deltaproteobacteria bacterium]